MGENLCVSWFHQKNIPVKIIRPFHTYGPGLKQNDGRVYADFIYSILENRNIVLNSRGEAKRAFCYMSDAIAGILLVTLNGKAGEAYNLGNPSEEWSIYEAAMKATECYPERRLKVTVIDDQIVSGYIKSRVIRNCPDIKKINALGWKPEVTLIEGFKRTIKYTELEREIK
jgi:nucleoside-diphosphate-sugar epimerase